MGPCLNIWFLSTKLCCKSRQELKHHQGYLTYRWGWWDVNVSSRKTKGKRESRKTTHSLCYIFFAQIVMSQQMSLCEAQNSGWGGSLLSVFSVSGQFQQTFLLQAFNQVTWKGSKAQKEKSQAKNVSPYFPCPMPTVCISCQKNHQEEERNHNSPAIIKRHPYHLQVVF